jgi:hypothetical protein
MNTGPYGFKSATLQNSTLSCPKNITLSCQAELGDICICNSVVIFFILHYTYFTLHRYFHAPFIACYRLVCPTGVADRVNLGKLILECFSYILSLKGQVKLSYNPYDIGNSVLQIYFFNMPLCFPCK